MEQIKMNDIERDPAEIVEIYGYLIKSSRHFALNRCFLLWGDFYQINDLLHQLRGQCDSAKEIAGEKFSNRLFV
jgi:hypothetical protein